VDEYGADVNETDVYGAAALHHAAKWALSDDDWWWLENSSNVISVFVHFYLYFNLEIWYYFTFVLCLLCLFYFTFILFYFIFILPCFYFILVLLYFTFNYCKWFIFSSYLFLN
jgi:hypothetical protein